MSERTKLTGGADYPTSLGTGEVGLLPKVAGISLILLACAAIILCVVQVRPAATGYST